jgi:HemX protein
MVVIAHFVAVTCYIGAAALAAAPFARPVRAPVHAVSAVLAAAVVAHTVALVAAGLAMGQFPIMGLGPALSFAALVLGVILLVVEAVTRDVTIALVAAPFAALATTLANIAGITPFGARGDGGLWLVSHIALSFVGIAAFATAAAAGTMYLVQRRELRSRRFAAVLRAFPPLQTLDRVNHAAAVVAWLTLTLGIVLAASYSWTFRALNVPQIVWGCAAWIAVSTLAFGRLLAGWQARRAALMSSLGFAGIIVLYVIVRMAGSASGAFL